MFKRCVVVAGAPRSGTSWLGQILDSCPATRYRFQPLFSHRFKGAISVRSSPSEIRRFLADVYETTDAFVCQTERRRRGYYPVFSEKDEDPPVLVLKTIRYHHLLAHLLESVEELHVIGIVRHPCGAVNSWLSCSEFPAGADPGEEWRHGRCRNEGRPEEYWGFDAWKRVVDIFLELEREYPQRMRFIGYESLVGKTASEVRHLFDVLSLPYTAQTARFLETCHSVHMTDAHAVFKSKAVCDRWRRELDQAVVREIFEELAGTPYERFL